MKELILVRHGKSSWDYDVADKDRPLKERGINDGHLVAGTFAKEGVAVDAIFSSPANRALHTCMIFLRTLDFPFKQFELSNHLYDFSGESVLNFVKNLDNAFKCVLIFGHNFAFTNMANSLGDQNIDNVPTTGLVRLRFDTDSWASVKRGKTVQRIFPKSLK